MCSVMGLVCFLMWPRPPVSTRTATLFPDTTLFRLRHPPQCPLRDRGRNPPAATLVDIKRAGRQASSCAGQPWRKGAARRSEEHTSELQSLMRISYAVFCLTTKIANHSPSAQKPNRYTNTHNHTTTRPSLPCTQ